MRILFVVPANRKYRVVCYIHLSHSIHIFQTDDLFKQTNGVSDLSYLVSVRDDLINLSNFDLKVKVREEINKNLIKIKYE